jgi:hypothetical protein
MGNTLVFIILFVLLILGFWLYSRSKSSPATAHKNIELFHAVSIKACPNACASVKKLKGKSFLANEVSQLPLSECNHKACTCSYIHHKDRRDNDDRRYLSSVMSGIYIDKEQRLADDDRRKKGSV